MAKKVFHELLSLEEARHRLFSAFKEVTKLPIDSETVAVKSSLGRVTAEAVFAKLSSPYFHSAAMDGYVVRSRDTFFATERDPLRIKVGEDCFWIETGDPVPEGFDAVIPVEDVTLRDGFIEIYHSVSPYQNIRAVGEDIVATELIIPENHIIRPVDIGAMLASGVVDIKVRRRPKVGIIPTGSELIPAERLYQKMPNPPELIEYNSSVLSNLIQNYGGQPIVYEIALDEENSIRVSILNALSECDIVIVNAGSGYGKEDLTYRIFNELGKVIINGVAIKPGKPFIAGFIEGKVVLGIPGYPVSTLLCFELFAKPLIEFFLNISIRNEDKIKAKLSRQVSSTVGVDEFIRVKVGRVGQNYIVTPMSRGAGLLMSVVRADGYIVVPRGSEGFSQGTELTVHLWRKKEEIENTIVCIGSHDNTLDVLYNFLRKSYPEVTLSSAHVGSMGGLVAIKKGEAHMAGTHLLDEETGEYNIRFIERIMPEKKVFLINLVYRIQGLIVKKGNPKGIRNFEDLTREDIVFINRQAGSGTRLLLDKALRELNLSPEKIRGYHREEYTHMGVAAAVLAGRADVGLGVYSAAVALDLDFIPVAEERYDLVIPQEFIELPMIKALLRIIREDLEFRETVRRLGGYDTRDMGKVIFSN